MKNLVVVDCEVYPNYLLVAFKNIDDGKVVTIECKGENSCLSDTDKSRLYNVMIKRETVGFNSVNYDIPVILAALRQRSCKDIKLMSNDIIENNLRGWQVLSNYKLAVPEIKHFDIAEVAPGVRTSLKLYGARLNSKTLWDLPYEPETVLTEEQMRTVKEYCINDLDTTIDLFNKIEDRVQLRREMVARYGRQVMSKSDAQVAEVVIKKELQDKAKGRMKIAAPKIESNAVFRYKTPDFIKFEYDKLNEVLTLIQNNLFAVDAKGSIKLPPELKKMKFKLGYSMYQLGVGGLHTNEKKQSIIPKDDELLIDKDVEAYYPRIILNQKLYPKHLGYNFLEVYNDIVNRRIKAKKEKNKVVNESLKIVINGSYGKLGNKYSCLYSPDLMIAVTLTGQLSLLMLIEQVEKHGIKVISANTDGFVSIVPKDKLFLYQCICFNWELITGFDLEETQYKALYSRDINNYLAIKLDGSIKGKGLFTIGELSKNPQGDISTIAIIDYLTKGTNIVKTIKECKDVSKFLFVRTVNGGALWGDKYLGKVVRWIYSTKGDVIKYKKVNKKGTQAKVPKSEGSRPIMTLGELPDDIDYKRYILECNTILDNLNLNLNLNDL